MSARIPTILPLAALAAAMSLPGCSGTGDLLCGGYYDPETGLKQSFGSSAAARKIDSFLETSARVVRAAREIDQDLLAVCTKIGLDLGIKSSELAPPADKENEPGARMDAACSRVAAEIDSVLRQNLPRGTHLTVVATPAYCSVDAQAQLECLRRCENVQITETEVRCKPGKLYGSCMAICSGQCVGSCSGQCSGTCAATCSGSCSGDCTGTCSGTCSARTPAGECVGTCSGTCVGRCDGQCSGSCNGACHGACMAQCTGECHGECSVMFTAPKCEEVEVTRTRTDCVTSCDARARVEARCTDPSLTIGFGPLLTPAQKEKVDRVLLTLQSNYARLEGIGYRVGTVVAGAVRGYAGAFSGITETAQEVGLQAGACVAMAAGAVVGAVAQIEIAVRVSVSVSASVEVGGGA